MIKRILLFFITLYQKTLSLDHGILSYRHPHGFCRFRPTCSEYAKFAIGKYGVFKGVALGAWRVMRCNPWNKGGWDPI